MTYGASSFGRCTTHRSPGLADFLQVPYRLNGSLWAGQGSGVYLSVDADGISVGGGLYQPSSTQLAAAREAIDSEPEASSELRALLARLRRRGFEVAGPDLTTAPRGYPRDHPDIALLRLNHYAALKPLPLDAGTDDVLATWRESEPLVRWARTWTH